MPKLNKQETAVALFVLLYTGVFTAIFISQFNFEFIFYVSVIVAITILLYLSICKGIVYSTPTLWLLAVWGLLHFLGGTSISGDTVVYHTTIIELIGEPYHILKYDQVIHMYGFFTAGFLLYDIFNKHFTTHPLSGKFIFLLLIGSFGLGAVNEMIEFIATLMFENVNVGGYENTLLDLFANAIGAGVAIFVLYIKSLKSTT